MHFVYGAQFLDVDSSLEGELNINVFPPIEGGGGASAFPLEKRDKKKKYGKKQKLAYLLLV